MMSGDAHSDGAQISAIVPPTMADAVEPKAPAKKRPTMTLWMFCALYETSDVRGYATVIIGETTEGSSHSDLDVEDEAENAADKIYGLPAELFAKGSREQRDDSKAKRIHGESDRCLELRRVKFARHGLKSECVCACCRSCGWMMR